jgi:hypothetical protein
MGPGESATGEGSGKAQATFADPGQAEVEALALAPDQVQVDSADRQRGTAGPLPVVVGEAVVDAYVDADTITGARSVLPCST